jgi:arylsulfatase A-like enzyme
MKRPNILYVHTHDTGRYVQPYGYAIDTPNIQKLAEDGVLFRQAFCAGPTCSPSRAALLTGQSPHSAGIYGLAHRGFSLKDYDQHLAVTLREAGYETVISGFEHVGWRKHAPDTYDRDLGCEGHAPHTHAIEFLQGQHDRPFFLNVGFTLTHREGRTFGFAPDLDAGEQPQTDPRYVHPPDPLPDGDATRLDLSAFMDCAREMDRRMGELFDALDRTGLAENTLVICTTDHGIPFPHMKCNLTDHGTGIMLIVRGPGRFTGGKAIDAMVSQIDLFPTICDLLEIDRPAWLEGESLLPLAAGEVDDIHDEVFSEVTYHAAYEPKRMVRTKRWKYIRRWGDRSTPVLPNCDDSLSKDLYLSAGWSEQPQPAERLFDLLYDPNEVNNLAGDRNYQGVLDDLRGRLTDWMERTDDPLLGGSVPPPSGAMVNRPDDTHPDEKPVRVE